MTTQVDRIRTDIATLDHWGQRMAPMDWATTLIAELKARNVALGGDLCSILAEVNAFGRRHETVLPLYYVRELAAHLDD